MGQKGLERRHDMAFVPLSHHILVSRHDMTLFIFDDL